MTNEIETMELDRILIPAGTLIKIEGIPFSPEEDTVILGRYANMDLTGVPYEYLGTTEVEEMVEYSEDEDEPVDGEVLEYLDPGSEYVH